RCWLVARRRGTSQRRHTPRPWAAAHRLGKHASRTGVDLVRSIRRTLRRCNTFLGSARRRWRVLGRAVVHLPWQVLEMIGVIVCGHHARKDKAETLAQLIGAGLVLDDGSRGSNANHDAAWRAAAAQGKQWSVVIEDDAICTPDLFAHMRDALAWVPAEGAVSLYLGASFPRR